MASASSQTDVPYVERGLRARRWLFRIGAVLLGLLPFLAFEALCTAFDWGRPGLHDDPFVGFRSTRPLFVLSNDGARYEIPKARQTYFQAESFAAHKPDNEYRTFVLGESTVQGNPYGIQTSFTTWLEIALTAADPARKWEVVNCGGISYASYRLAPVLEEVLAYQPDLVILCVGHNEFLEARTFEHVADRGELLNASLAAASRWRTFNLAREAYLRTQGVSSSQPAASRPILPTEVDVLLDYRGGLEEYHHDADLRRGAVAQYEYNLRRMVQMARDAGVPMILIDPVCNLADTPPFKSEHRPGLSVEDQHRWTELSEEASRRQRGEDRDAGEAVALLEQACQIDPDHAGGWYNLAKCYEIVGRWNDARRAYLRAKDADVCPLRILEPMHEVVSRVAEQYDVPLVDAQQRFADRSAHGITSGSWLADHVHPTIEGHQVLADELVGTLTQHGIVDPLPDWEATKRKRYTEHYNSLDALYFAKGLEHLKMLRNWSAGRAERIRPTTATLRSQPPAPSP
jgi:lysophospholipase L1-like esterase